MDDCTVSFDEAIRLIGQLQPVLGDTDGSQEFKDIAEARDLKSRCHQLSTEREQRIKDDIIALTSACDGKIHVTSDTDGDDVLVKVARMSQQIESIEQRRAAILEEVGGQEREIEGLSNAQDQIARQRATTERDTTEMIPGLRHDVNLYTYLTGVRWEYDCPDDDIKGYVSNKASVKPFSLNTNQNSKFFIANYLWDLMEPDW